MSAWTKKISSKYYEAHDELKKVMDRLDKLGLDSIELDKKERANEITRQDLVKNKDALKRRRTALNPRKNEILKGIIFPSMANLTMFLEYMAKNPYVNDVFEEDLKALFLGKSESEENKKWPKNAPIFQRFIEAAIMRTVLETNKRKHKVGGDNMPLSDLSPILCNYMQQTVYRAMQIIAPNKYTFHNPTTSAQAVMRVMRDMDDALTRTHEIADEANRRKYSVKPNRMPQF